MSADFWSFAIPMPSADARGWVERLRSDELCGDILDVDEQTLHRFNVDAAELDPVAMRAAYAGEVPPLIEPAYVGGQHLELLELGNPTSSPNYPFIVVMDRAVALPEGIELLRGRACASLSDRALQDLDDAMETLGDAMVITRIVPFIDRWGNGLDDAREGLETLRGALVTARQRELTLLLVGMAVP